MRRLLGCCVLLMLPLSAARGQTAGDLAQAQAEILPLLDSMESAANAHDAERHLAYYVRDATLRFVINTDEIVGYEALLAQQRQWWKNGKADVTYVMVGRPDFLMPAPGLVMVTYFLTSTRTQADGTTGHARFGISSLWQRRPEGWRIIYAHESMVAQ
jgi:ketosteroid isomerase-like protein